MAVMPAEIRATVQLYLAGKIRQWYSREDGRGGIFLLNTGDLAEAKSPMESLQLAKEGILDHEYIPVGPLRFFGLVFILPGVVGNLPESFATFAAYGDFATGLLAMLALLTVRIRPLFGLFVVAFNLVGAADLIIDYYHVIQLGLPALAGELGSTYAILIIYAPLLMITHVVAFYLVLRLQPTVHRAIVGNTVAR
jgi:hypothetical protein